MKAVLFAKPSKRLPGKHLMDFCAEPMIKRIFRTLESTGLFERVIILSKYDNLGIEGCRVEKDESKGTLINSLVDSIKILEEFIAVGGDMPLLDADIIENLVGHYHGRPVAAANSDGLIEPLFAIYNASIFADLLEFSKKSRKISPFVEERFELVRMDPEQSAKLANVNTLEELNNARLQAGCLNLNRQ